MSTHHYTATHAEDDGPGLSLVTEVLESISDGVCLLNPEWRITYVNRCAAAYLGLAPADLIGKHLWDSYPQLIGTEIEQYLRATMATRQPRDFDMPALFNDRWQHVQLSPSPEGMVVCFRDITEQKTMAQALEASERRYRELLTHAPSAIYEIDFRSKRFITVNDTMCRLTGYTRDELLAMNPFELLDDDGRKVFQDRISAWLAGQSPDANVEYNVRAKDGHIIYAALDVTFTVDEHGQPLSTTVVGHDITQRRKIDEALRESEERYRRVVENTTAIILRVNLQGIITFANERALEFFSYTNDELIGRHAVGSIVPPRETSGRDLAVMVDQIRANPDSFHANANENMRKNGERVWIEWTNSGIYDAEGHLKEFLSVGIDATQRRWAEEALRESEAKFRLLTDMISAAIVIVQDGMIQYANPFLLQRGGYREAEVIGQPFQRVIHPDYHAMLAERYRRRLRGEPVPEHDEVEGVTSSGEHGGWYDFHSTVISYQGRPAVLITAHDITERKRMEQALLEADHAKDEFLAVLSHELQTPLTSMLGWSAEALRVGTPEMMATAMPIVHRNALRQKRLITDLLDFSRLIHHKMHLIPVPLDLGEQATEAVENIRQLAVERQLHLSYEPTSVPLPILTDPARMQQCIGNLLNNSLKFTQEGGSITVRCRRDGDHAILTVEDTGRGIPPEVLPAIFDVFRQVDRDERAGGLGLGLAVTRGIIELHDGSIRAESAGQGRGSTFTITLPLTPVDAGESTVYNNK